MMNHIFIMILRITVIVILLIFQSFPASAQHSQIHGTRGHGHGSDDPHDYHIGVGIAATQVKGEKGPAPGVHLHLLRQLGEHNRWGLGFGYEAILDEHVHNGFNLLLNYRPAHFISFVAGPGVVLANHEGRTELKPALHTEAVFEFNVGGLHMGPMIGFGTDREESHFSLGIHIGFGF